jgi:hypothetical protein
MKFNRFVLGVLAVVLNVAAQGQQVNTNVTSGDGDYKVMRSWNVSTLDPHPTDCAEQVNAVREALVSFNLPISQGFTYVVVCDANSWFKLKNSPRYRRVNTITGMTDFTNYVVYLNGFRRASGELRDTTAHEIGHMLCNCNDEDTADENKLKVLAGTMIAKK